MSIIVTIMSTTTGQSLQKMTFGRMPRPGAAFVLESGTRVTAQRVDVHKPAPGRFVGTVEIWVVEG
jgi:hypothetical protein